MKINRRRILKATSAGFGSGLLSTAVAAENPSDKRKQLKKVADEYDSPSQARQAVREYGTRLLKTLDNKGYLESHRVSDLGIDEILTKEELSKVDEGVMVGGVMSPDGPTARIHIKKPLEERTLTIAIEPHRQRSSATIPPKVGSDEGTVYRSESNGPVTTSACIKDQACIFYCESGDPYGSCECSSFEIYCCSDGSCSVGGLVQPGCPVKYCCDNCVDICDNETGDC